MYKIQHYILCIYMYNIGEGCKQMVFIKVALHEPVGIPFHIKSYWSSAPMVTTDPQQNYWSE